MLLHGRCNDNNDKINNNNNNSNNSHYGNSNNSIERDDYNNRSNDDYNDSNLFELLRFVSAIADSASGK